MGARAGTASLLITTLSIVIALSSSFRSSEAASCGVAVYWGQNSTEGSLEMACNANNYKYVNIAFLTGFGGGRQPFLNLDGHCDSSAGGCRNLSRDIHFCQDKNIKVLLSIGGPDGNYFINSPQEAKNVANYLWRSFLAGDPNGPLGGVTLDGVDFSIGFSPSTLYWEDLAKELQKLKSNIDLAAAPSCKFPDVYLGSAIKNGYFDYVWVQFYNNPLCDYTQGVATLESAWDNWSSILPGERQIFLGLPADRLAATTGFIPVDTDLDDILKHIKKSNNYGGLMLWNRYWDELSSYSNKVAKKACNDPKQEPHIKMVAEN